MHGTSIRTLRTAQWMRSSRTRLTALEYIDCYHALAELAPRELKPGGHLLVMVGQLNMPEIIAALNRPPLVYRWALNYRMGGPPPAS